MKAETGSRSLGTPEFIQATDPEGSGLGRPKSGGFTESTAKVKSLNLHQIRAKCTPFFFPFFNFLLIDFPSNPGNRVYLLIFKWLVAGRIAKALLKEELL